MKILEVIPIARGINTDTLSYFSGNDIPIGSIIKVPLRKRIVPALVINSKDVEESKTEIKNSSFSLKKIEKVKHNNLLSKKFVDAAEETANYYVGTIGSVLNSIVPKALLENIDKIKIPENNLIDIFNGEPLKKLRREHLNKQFFSACEFCNEYETDKVKSRF